MSTPRPFATRIQKVPTPLRLGLLFLAFGLAGWWWVDYSGPYRALAEAQLEAFGSYEMILTGLVTILLTLLPTVFILYGISLAMGPPTEADAAQVRARTVITEAWIRENIGYVFGGIFTVGMLGAAAVITGMMLSYGTLHACNLEDLEAGNAPPSRYLRTGGEVLWDRSMVIEETGQSTLRTVYAPLVSPTW
ncbi:MAG: hypothetical protein KDA28_17040, partial [Phycisphaerales bacterium]|nr:hypothetical protein [Phycisphaerales bacterium]